MTEGVSSDQFASQVIAKTMTVIDGAIATVNWSSSAVPGKSGTYNYPVALVQ